MSAEEPNQADSAAMKLALLPARARYWREQGQEATAARLQAEYDAATSDGKAFVEEASAEGEARSEPNPPRRTA